MGRCTSFDCAGKVDQSCRKSPCAQQKTASVLHSLDFDPVGQFLAAMLRVIDRQFVGGAILMIGRRYLEYSGLCKAQLAGAV